ncbi:MAG: hypothetical protein JO097_00145 [Acidobacteriaceae bacterium]|nr:hypothetical protein [Acidobacteriaceae bacterium]MBV9300886.1 hypothetical protein [Acidobacteriaceae bacterium]
MINHTAMDETFQAILDSLPPKQPRSKLEPYAELIQELRKRGRSYREIAGILEQRCGIKAGTHTVYNFVRVRASSTKKGKSVKAGTGRSIQPAPVARPVSEVTAAAADSERGNDEVWQRIQALKQRTTAGGEVEKKEFQFDENEPLRLISDTQHKK